MSSGFDAVSLSDLFTMSLSVNPTAYRLVLALALVASLAVAALFASRAVHYAKSTRAESEGIRPWMSVPYIAHSKHVPARVLWKALGIPPHSHDRRPIGRIARAQGRPVEELIAALRAAIAYEQSPSTPK